MWSLKKTFIFASLISALIFACQTSTTNDEATQTEEKEPSIMYEASELAGLMRAMHDQSKAWKNTLTSEDNEKIALDFPEFYQRMHTAEATNPREINENYHLKADAFLESTKTFVQADFQDKIHTYNLMIASCVDCHQDFCRGPIQKINKLVIE